MNNRNTRILVSVIGIPVILASVFLGGLFFLAFCLIIGILAFTEYCSIASNKEIDVNLYFGTFAVAAFIINSYYDFTNNETLLIVILLFLLLLELFRNKTSFINGVNSLIFGIVYFGLFIGLIVKIREFYNYSDILYSQGGYIIFALLTTIWICDSAAYFLGVAFGKHKLFPRVSPKKSWEGSIAGFIFAFISMIAAKFIYLEFLDWEAILVIAFIVGVFGQIGDLIESIIKRDGGVKDSSALIPGHGGVFDRFDSLLFTAPLIYLYLTYFN